MQVDQELERQLRAFGRTLQHDVGEPITPSAASDLAPASTGAPHGRTGRSTASDTRRWPVIAAAAALVVAAVGALVLVGRGGTPESPAATGLDATPDAVVPSESDVVQIDHVVLVDGEPVGEPWSSGLARDAGEFDALWVQLGLPDRAPTIDFDDNVVIYFGPAESSSCHFGPLDGVSYDPATGRVFPVLPFEDPGVDGEERICTDDDNPHAIVVAVERSDLPTSGFEVWTDNLDPPACCGSNVTRIAAGELYAAVLPEPSSLRYSEPLPDDAAVFVNDLSLLTPELFEPVGIPGPEPQQNTRSASVVLLDGSEVAATGTIGDLPVDWDPSAYTGAPVDIGVDGAAFTDEQEAAIVYPVDGQTRIVASKSFFLDGSRDPAVTADELAVVARAVGGADDWASAELERQGVYVFDELRSSSPVPGRPQRVVVDHGPTMSVVLQRFDQARSEQWLLAFAANAFENTGTGIPDDVELGDTAIVADVGYVELLSPVDVVVVTFARPAIDTLLDVAEADGLVAAFDGVVDAPPRPAP